MIYHAINYIPEAKNEFLRTVQSLLIDSINKFKTEESKFVSIQFSNENAAEDADIELQLERDSQAITADRKLPMIKDLFTLLASTAQDDSDWIGFTNSDVVIPSSEFYKYISASKADALLFNRTEIEGVPLTLDLEEFLSYKRVSNPYEGRDGFFFRKSVWNEISEKLPDYILAEPYWDLGLIELLKPYSPVVVNELILHYFHPRRWFRDSPGALYNLDLWNKQPKYHERKA